MRSFLLGLCLTCCAAGVQALEVDAAECKEGAQFIGNAAHSRKNGITKEFFVGKLEEDLFVLSSIPAELRWFAHGDVEADFLRAAVTEVFDFPREPAEHAKAFYRACLQTAGLDTTLADLPLVDPIEEEDKDWNGNA